MGTVFSLPALITATNVGLPEKYRDPLLPRDTDQITALPRGVTPEMEKKWLTDLAAAKKKREQAGQ